MVPLNDEPKSALNSKINFMRRENKSQPLVSIIMPCFNAAATLPAAIESVLNQSYPAFELIIIDDKSTDQSASIIDDYSRIDDRIKLFSNSGRRGVSNARNIGIRSAVGQYICFLDADDFYFSRSLEIRIAKLQQDGCKVIYGSYYRLLNDGRKIFVDPPERVKYSDMLLVNHIGNLTGLYDAGYFGNVLQDETRHEDYAMWCRLIAKVDFAYKASSEPLGVYRVSNDSLSGNKIKSFYWHWIVLRDVLKIRLIPAVYFQIYYCIFSLAKRLNL